MAQEYKACTAFHTPTSKSPYPKNQVPINFFFKDPTNPVGKLFDYCWHCREYGRLRSLAGRAKLKEKALTQKQSVLNGETDFMFCNEQMHGGAAPSQYPRDRVPKEMFRKTPNDPKSDFYLQCSDCRSYKAAILNGWKVEKRQESIEQGFVRCANCHEEMTYDELAKNVDGTISVHCTPCKEEQNVRNGNRSIYFDRILIEMIEKHQCSCYKCKSLYYTASDSNSLIPTKLETYLKPDGNRYLIYENYEFSVSYFLSITKNLLELDIIQLDHLPEIEQRARGLLSPSDTYIPKKDEVSSLMSESAKKLEALKTQHLCILCHVEETMSRESGYGYKTELRRIKEEYINNIKAAGCSSCGFQDLKCSRKFDMDHLDPNFKIANVSVMMLRHTYTLQNVKEECAKCRVLCKHCHWIHTCNQRKSKVIVN